MRSVWGNISKRRLLCSVATQASAKSLKAWCCTVWMKRAAHITPCIFKIDKHHSGSSTSSECFTECWMNCRNKPERWILLLYILYVLFEDRASREGPECLLALRVVCLLRLLYDLPQAQSLCQLLGVVPLQSFLQGRFQRCTSVMLQ